MQQLPVRLLQHVQDLQINVSGLTGKCDVGGRVLRQLFLFD
jgi:hypothetical protein